MKSVLRTRMLGNTLSLVSVGMVSFFFFYVSFYLDKISILEHRFGFLKVYVLSRSIMFISL